MRKEKAMALFEEGYNCAQAVFLAFEDLHGFDRHTAAALSSSFGGGMGRLREVCGTVSGMFMVAGVLYGYEGKRKRSITRGFRNLQGCSSSRTARLSAGSCSVFL